MKSNAPELSTWLSWKRNCALDLCDAEEQAQLAAFVGPILINRWNSQSRGVSIENLGSDTRPPHLAAFHYFETYMHSSSGATGKKWKDWLFAKSEQRPQEQPQHEAIKALVIRLLGNAVLTSMMKGEVSWKPKLRKIADGEARPAELVFVSMHEPQEADGKTWSVEDLLPTATYSQPDNEAALKELETEGHAFAQSYFENLDFVTRATFMAATLDIGLAEEVVERVTGKKKSVLYARLELPKDKQVELVPPPGRRFSALWLGIRTELGDRWTKEDKLTLDLLADFALAALSEINLTWAETEKQCEPLFSFVSSKLSS
jgi:hypothetical protein